MAKTSTVPGLENLPEALASDAQAAWDTIAGADLAACEALASRPDRSQIARVLVLSEFISRWCAANPVELTTMIRAGDLDRPFDTDEIIQRTADAVADCIDEASLMSALRRLRIKEWVRVAWRDLTGEADVAEVTGTLSAYADCCTDTALQKCAEFSDTDPTGFFVLGMGKLGGGELNFSSDIDIMFALDGDTEPGRPALRLAQRLTRVLGELTADGFVFRVDTRLRPHGTVGPIIYSTEAMEHYYQTHGRDWERYALTKARTVAGDIDAGTRFLANIKPFVYRKYLDFGAFEAIRSMHGMISQELKKTGTDNDVKRGRGGIRQIEFIAQSQQLLRGGRDVVLQTPQLGEALTAMCSLGELDESSRAQLYDDYCFLRQVEHRLQIYRDEQTHTLAHDELSRLRLAVGMGFDDIKRFDKHLEQLRDRVDKEFRATFRISDTEHAEPSLWPLDEDGDDATKRFADCGYDDPAEAARLAGLFQGGAMVQSLSSEGRQRLDLLMPLLITECARSERPSRCLREVIRLIEQIGRRPTYFSALIEYPVALEQVVALCDASPWLGQWLGSNPMLLEELLAPIEHEQSDAGQLNEDLDQNLAGIDSSDTEAVMQRLREFRHSQVFAVAARALRLDRSPIDTANDLTRIAEVVIDHVRTCAIELSRGRLPARINDEPKLAVVGYGKLGSSDMGYTSDIDIVFVYDDGGEYDDELAAGYARIAQRMISLLTTRLASGLLYEVDVRLRPSGSKGLLVTSVDAFAKYQRTDAWTFEHQALVRARAISGDPQVCDRFNEIRKAVLCVERDPKDLAVEVANMRERMIEANDQSDGDRLDLKLGRGALVDIEFIVQYGVLLMSARHPELADETRTVLLIDELGETGLLEPEETKDLKRIFEFYLGEINRLRMMELEAIATSPEVDRDAERVRAIWNRLLATD